MTTPKRKVVFLDRDGVINFDPGDYTWEVEKFKLVDGLVEGLKMLQSKGYEFIVITNQGGIAKGIYSMADVELCHQKMISLLKSFEIEILDIFISTHHEVVCNSLDRKPGSLMIERAMALYGVKEAIMIGDKQTDVQAAEHAGIRGLLIPKNSPLSDVVDFLD